MAKQSVPDGDVYKKIDNQDYLSAAKACNADSDCQGYTWGCPDGGCLCEGNLPFCDAKFPKSSTFSLSSEEDDSTPAATQNYLAKTSPIGLTLQTTDSPFCKDHRACGDVHPADGLCCPVADGSRLYCCDQESSNMPWGIQV